MHNFWYLTIFNIVGIVLNIGGAWVAAGGSFKSVVQPMLPRIIVAFIAGETMIYFIDKPITQAMQIVLAQMAIGLIFEGIIKLGRKGTIK